MRNSSSAKPTARATPFIAILRKEAKLRTLSILVYLVARVFSATMHQTTNFVYISNFRAMMCLIKNGVS